MSKLNDDLLAERSECRLSEVIGRQHYISSITAATP